MPNGYGPLKTPLTLGSKVSRAFDWRVLFLNKMRERKEASTGTETQVFRFVLAATHVHC